MAVIDEKTECKVKTMLEKGLSIQYIGDIIGISREKVKQVQIKFGIATKDRKRGWRYSMYH